MEQNKPQTEQELTQQAAVRRQKLADLCEAGHNPFETHQILRRMRTRPTSK